MLLVFFYEPFHSIFWLENLININNFNFADLTVIFSITSCASTWEIFEHVQRERLLLMAITDPDCPRLPLHEALTVITAFISFPICFYWLIFFSDSADKNWR